MGASWIDAAARALAGTGSRRTILSLWAVFAIGRAIDTTAKKRRKTGKREKKPKCYGPCTHDLCLLYMDEQYGANRGYSPYLSPYLQRECCSRLLLAGLRGRAYRNAVIACPDQILPNPPPPPYCDSSPSSNACSLSGAACECDTAMTGANVCADVPSRHIADNCVECGANEVCLVYSGFGVRCATLCADPR